MQMIGPYGTPLALGREPWTAAFFALCAPLLFPIIALETARVAVGGGDIPLATSWVIICVAVGLQFAVLSIWSERLGAGPFAGGVEASGRWLLIGVIAGPACLFLPVSIIDTFMSGDDNWIYREGGDPDVFTKERWTAAFLFYVVFLAPIVEEVTFRGVVIGAVIARGGSAILAAVLSAAAFAVPHLQYSNLALVAVFVTGLGLAALRLFSGTVVVPIAAHMAANAVAILQTA